jgi:hypothetical protein
MSKKYFNYQGAPWQIIETQDPWGKPMTYAVEMDSTYGAMLNTEEYSEGSDWEYVQATDVRIDEWFLKSDPNDLFGDDEYEPDEEPFDPAQTVNTSKLKAMLDQLNNRPTDGPTRHWSITQDDDPTKPNGTIDRAVDILSMIRARQENEMAPTVILNARKYTDSTTLESALETIRKKDAEAEIWVGTTRADDFLATLKNQENFGLSSVPIESNPLGITLDQEALELIKQLRPKK